MVSVRQPASSTATAKITANPDLVNGAAQGTERVTRRAAGGYKRGMPCHH
jgi:hypothetical protein